MGCTQKIRKLTGILGIDRRSGKEAFLTEIARPEQVQTEVDLRSAKPVFPPAQMSEDLVIRRRFLRAGHVRDDGLSNGRQADP